MSSFCLKSKVFMEIRRFGFYKKNKTRAKPVQTIETTLDSDDWTLYASYNSPKAMLCDLKTINPITF